MPKKDLPDAWTDTDKASYNRYKEVAEKEPGYKPASFDAISTDKEKLRDITEKLAKEKENYTGRGSGKAAPFDSEGGMSPGQSPSLYNPIKEKKGGAIKKKPAKKPSHPNW